MNKKGFTLLELVVVIALVAILVSVGSLSARKTVEKRALEKAKSEVAETMRSYVERSYNEGSEYTIAVASGSVVVFDGDKDSTDEVKRIILPEMLNYHFATTEDGTSVNELKISTDGKKVEDDERMIVRINDRNDEPIYRVEMLKKSVSELMEVRVTAE